MDVIEKSFAPVFGQYCWGLHYDAHLNLIMNFGDPFLEVHELGERGPATQAEFDKRRSVSARGKWILWIFRSQWNVVCQEKIFASSSSPMARRRRAIALLSGQKLQSVKVGRDTGWTCFGFDLVCRLEVGPPPEEGDEELWLLYKPSGYVLAVRQDLTYDHVPVSETDKRRRVQRRPLFPGKAHRS